jgi:ectoine hydroxylase-related dioxygenase (phytanoyl-CoA dioxygenase family)
MTRPPSISATTPFRRTDNPRAALLEDGYCFLPGLLPRERVAETRSQLLAVAAAAGWLAAGSRPDDAVPGPVVHDERDLDDFLSVYREVQKCEQFHRLGQSPELLAVVEDILGEATLCLPAKIARFAYPDSDVGPTPAHQDYYYVQGSVDTLTAWIPLGPVAAGEGRLAVLAGSHRLGPLPPIPLTDGRQGFWLETDDLGLDWHGGDYDAGDVLLFHSLTVHGAEDNHSSRLRVSSDVRFQPVADRVGEASMLPHYTPDLAWADAYRGWSDPSLQWYWRDLPVEIVGQTSDVQRLVAQSSSRLLATAGAPTG